MSKETVKFKLEITMPKRWAKKFIQMLDCMRWCGNVGASRVVAFYADGDGDFRPFDFKVNNKEVKKLADWNKLDVSWDAKYHDDNEIHPALKSRKSIDFFFDAG